MDRERITITLRRDILKRVDKSIDGAKLRNRSHAIEYFLAQQLSPQKSTIVLNLQPHIRNLYQATGMKVSLKGNLGDLENWRQNLERIFKQLSDQGFEKILILTPSEELAALAQDESVNFGLSLEIIEASENEKDTRYEITNLIENGDYIYWDARFPAKIDLVNFLEFHRHHSAPATAALALGGKSSVSFIGQNAILKGHQIIELGIFDRQEIAGLPLVGIVAFNKDAVNQLNGQIFTEILPKLADEGHLHGYVFEPYGQETKQTKNTLSRQSIKV